MEKKRQVILFFCFILVSFPSLCRGQLQVKIGNDTTFCACNIEQGVQLAPYLSVKGGTAPYQYFWSISEPYEYVPGRFSYASSVLNDTTLANPIFLSAYINDPQAWTHFILTVEDANGNKAKDSINVRFSEYMASIPEPTVYLINKGDSVFLNVSDSYHGGILPYISYSWDPGDGINDPVSPKVWFKPGKNTHYICMVTDSAGCAGYIGSGFLFIVKSETAIQFNIKNNKIYQRNGNIFFDNPDNKSVKLSFYDLSGKLVHEGITTAGWYNPVFTGTGTVFLCKININNKQQTIKYIVP